MSEYRPTYKKLVVYQKAHQLVLRTYRLTKTFPRDEQYGLVSQMRRAGVSVPANIIEGWSRQTLKEKRNFYHIARGSLAELLYYLDLVIDLELVTKAQMAETYQLASETMQILQGLINHVSEIIASPNPKSRTSNLSVS